MSATKDSLAAARESARDARTQLHETMGQIKERLQPSTLMQEGLDAVRERRDALQQDAIEAAQKRPAAVGGAAAAVVLFLLRKPLVRLTRRMFSRRDETRARQAG